MIKNMIMIGIGITCIELEILANKFFYYVGGISSNTSITISGTFSHTFIIVSLFGAFLIGYSVNNIYRELEKII